MKLSVSVPDELWNASRAVVEGDSPSAVVQAALSQLVSRGGEKAYAKRPVLQGKLADSAAAARKRLLEDASARYQDGYRQGVELAVEMNWAQLSEMVQKGVIQAAKSAAFGANMIALHPEDYPADAKPRIDPALLAKYVGTHADWQQLVDWIPSEITVEGMDQALRDMWEQVRSPDTERSTGSTPATNPQG